MAGIDKTYVNKEQYIVARAWWLETFEKQKADLGFAQWLYPLSYAYSGGDKNLEYNEIMTREFLEKNTEDINQFDFIENDEKELCLWNTGYIFDMWLIKNCPLDFIQARLRSQYSEDNWFFKYAPKMDFTERPAIYQIEKNDVFVYFYKDVESETDIPVLLDKMIVYGTTYFFKLLQDAKDSFKYYSPKRDPALKMKLRYFGLDVVYEDLKFYVIDQDDNKLDEIQPEYSESLFRAPEFIYSFDLKDCEGCIEEQIIMSHEDEAFDIKQYKDSDIKMMRRYLLFAPEYITCRIKKD